MSKHVIVCEVQVAIVQMVLVNVYLVPLVKDVSAFVLMVCLVNIAKNYAYVKMVQVVIQSVVTVTVLLVGVDVNAIDHALKAIMESIVP